mmetsp:Transcript_46939/g.75444  ORF Transcript_46939/g.75444 Transcript_46939/m.75444 type:complete len:196 (-) Transcript_46939:106-693(-)
MTNSAKSRVIYKGFTQGVSLEDLREEARNFAEERDWNQFHTPRNVLLALVGEVGELAEIFQWKGEVSPGVPEFSEKERVHLGEELSDVLIYLVRLADRCQIDLASAARRKMEQNALKYPADKAKGRSDKYTAYEEKAASKESKSGTGKVKSETEGLTKGNQVSNKNSTSWMSSGSFLVIFAAIAVYVVIYLAVGH